MTPATSLAERFSIAKKWLDDCENKHEECIDHALVFENKHKSYLPTRVIDLQGIADSASVRIEMRARPEITWGRYAALSHRWPVGPCSWVTTEANLQARIDKISISELPQTI